MNKIIKKILTFLTINLILTNYNTQTSSLVTIKDLNEIQKLSLDMLNSCYENKKELINNILDKIKKTNKKKTTKKKTNSKLLRNCLQEITEELETELKAIEADSDSDKSL